MSSCSNDAEPQTSKESRVVDLVFNKIYSRKLRWPDTLIVDPGREFMGSVTVFMKKHVTIQRTKHVSIVLKPLLNVQVIFDDRSRELVNRLPPVLKAINNKTN